MKQENTAENRSPEGSPVSCSALAAVIFCSLMVTVQLTEPFRLIYCSTFSMISFFSVSISSKIFSWA